MRLAAAAIFLVSALPALADGLDDRLAAIRGKLADDDPAVRALGDRELAAVASEAGSRLKVLLADPDPEVRGRAADVFAREGIVPEDGKTARVRELLAALAEEPKVGEDRVAVLRELLGIHPNVAQFVLRELGNPRVRLLEDPSRVVRPGLIELSATAVNDSDLGAWIRPDSFRLSPDFRPFGERPNWRVGRCGGVIRSFSIDDFDDDPTEAALRYLATLVRIPPGGRFQLAAVTQDRPFCGALVVRLRTDYFRAASLEAEFSGIRFTFAEPAAVEGAPGVRTILGERPGESATAVAFDGPDGRGLELTAVKDLEAEPLTSRDPFWWAALAEDGTFLGSGAFGTTPEDLAAMKAGEKRRVAMRDDPPEGTATLWMGYSHKLEECVPPPLRLK